MIKYYTLTEYLEECKQVIDIINKKEGTYYKLKEVNISKDSSQLKKLLENIESVDKDTSLLLDISGTKVEVALTESIMSIIVLQDNINRDNLVVLPKNFDDVIEGWVDCTLKGLLTGSIKEDY